MKWIKVTDEFPAVVKRSNLPDKTADLLVYTSGGTIVVGAYYPIINGWYPSGSSQQIVVTHWSELPKPPVT